MSAPSPADVLARGRAAQKTWSALGVARRCTSLSKARRMIAEECESIAATIATEVAKVPLDALSGDVLVTLEHMRYCEFHAKDILRSHPVDKPSIFFLGAQFEVCYEPHGVALIFGPSNYPFQLAMIPLVTALVAGNAVVLKCSERTPETAHLIAKVFSGAGLPENLVQVFHDGPEKAAMLIDARPDFIFFTGSSRHGQQVAAHAARYLIPAVFELGGKDAALVFADCHFERAIEGITYGAFSNAGRVCIGVKRVYVQASIYYRFLDALMQRIAELHTGTTSSDADLCGLLEREQVELRSHVEDALRRGARMHWPITSGGPLNGPVLLSDVPTDALLLAEEFFGPVLCIAPFTDEAEAVELANASSFALGSSVWTRNRGCARRVAAQLSAGSCSVNDVIRQVANPYAAFGGNRLSGYGRYRGPEGFRTFSRTKTILRANGRARRERHWFPFTGRTRSQLAALIRFRHGTKGLVALLGRILLPLLLAACLPVAFAAQPGTETHLAIDVSLPPQAHGELAYLVFASPAGFPGDREKALRLGFLPIAANAHQLHIDLDLPPGTYAVSVYEDLNGNHKLDHNLIGIPREPVGVSRNPHPRFGPPRFDECSFEHGTGNQTITINLVQGL